MVWIVAWTGGRSLQVLWQLLSWTISCSILGFSGTGPTLKVLIELVQQLIGCSQSVPWLKMHWVCKLSTATFETKKSQCWLVGAFELTHCKVTLFLPNMPFSLTIIWVFTIGAITKNALTMQAFHCDIRNKEKSMLTCRSFKIDVRHYCCISQFMPFLLFLWFPAKLQIKTFLEATCIATNYQTPTSDHLFDASLKIFSFDALYWNVMSLMLKQGLIRCAWEWNHKGFERDCDYHVLDCTGNYNSQKKAWK